MRGVSTPSLFGLSFPRRGGCVGWGASRSSVCLLPFFNDSVFFVCSLRRTLRRTSRFGMLLSVLVFGSIWPSMETIVTTVCCVKCRDFGFERRSAEECSVRRERKRQRESARYENQEQCKEVSRNSATSSFEEQ